MLNAKSKFCRRQATINNTKLFIISYIVGGRDRTEEALV